MEFLTEAKDPAFDVEAQISAHILMNGLQRRARCSQRQGAFTINPASSRCCYSQWLKQPQIFQRQYIYKVSPFKSDWSEFEVMWL